MDALRKKTWESYGGRYDRTILPAYGLPRQLTSTEVDEVLKTRGRTGKHQLRITARDYAQVAAHLAIRDGELDAVDGEAILCCGEGASNFGQTLEKRGAACVAFDRLYLTPREVMAQQHLITTGGSDYLVNLVTPDEALARLPKRIIGGELDHLPFADGTFDKVFAPHVLYWYLDPSYSADLGRGARQRTSQGRAIIAECVRATADGGYFQFNLASRAHCAKVATHLRKHYAQVEQRSDWVLRIYK